jgi:CheY-like chemotaxis protein
MALAHANVDAELTVINDGADALSLVRGEGKYRGRSTPHLAVLDLNLPKHGGPEVLVAMRDDPDFSSVPVVVTSSSPASCAGSAVEFAQVKRYIRKPPALDEFLQIGTVIKEMLQNP